MNLQKTLLGGIVGGIVYFFLGYAVYGLLLKSFFETNGMVVDMEKMVWWAMIAGNLAGGFLLAYILSKSNASTAAKGAGIGVVVGLLTSMSFDLIMFGTGQNPMTTTGICADVAASAVMTAIAGAIVAAVMGMGKKAAA